jgi:hypothetical protein
MTTQTDLLLDWFLSGHSITPLEARYPPFNCLALSQRCTQAMHGIYDGICWPILSEPFKTESGKTVARYSMPGKPHIAYG